MAEAEERRGLLAFSERDAQTQARERWGEGDYVVKRWEFRGQALRHAEGQHIWFVIRTTSPEG